MHVLVVLVVLTRLAAAESPLDVKLGPGAAFLGDRIRLVLPLGSDVDPLNDGAVFDWGTAILTIRVLPATFAEVRGDAKDRGIDVDHARIEPLEVGAPLTGVLVIPRPPRRAGDPDLVAAAYYRFPDGGGAIAAFYIDVGGLDGVATWTSVARRIAATARAPALDRTHVTVGRLALDLPRGYSAHRSSAGGFDLSGRAGQCALREDEPASQSAPGDGTIVVTTIAGHMARWVEWATVPEPQPRFEDELYDERLRVGVRCTSTSRDGLAMLRWILASLQSS
jgi:hypothetical protein